MVLPGLEAVASEEIVQSLKAQVRRTKRGLVVFRVPTLDASILQVRTVEDVFLLAWGTDELTLRAADLDSIRAGRCVNPIGPDFCSCTMRFIPSRRVSRLIDW